MDSQPGFDVAALDEWIGDRLPGRGLPLRATRMGEGTGEANALYWLRRGEHVWVLRRPPAVINAPGASDMNREWRILTALEGTSVPHPAPLLLGGPDGPLGIPFLIGSLRPGPDELVYACAKAGLNALTVGLAEAFGPRVRANAILPGAVLTDIAKAWPADRLRRASEGVPLGRAGQPADLVGTALWLASRASDWVTGVLVRVDGGFYRQTS